MLSGRIGRHQQTGELGLGRPAAGGGVASTSVCSARRSRWRRSQRGASGGPQRVPRASSSKAAAILPIPAPPISASIGQTRFWKVRDLTPGEGFQNVNHSSGYTFQVWSKWCSSYSQARRSNHVAAMGCKLAHIAVP